MLDYIMLLDENLKKKLEENHPWTGIYKLCILSNDLKTLVPVQRMLKNDPKGILYIGSSDDIPNKIENLKVSIAETFSSNPILKLHSRIEKHTCGKKFLNNGVREKFPLENLCVHIIPSNKNSDMDSHYTLEAKEISKYENDFGEPPPLN